MTHREVLEALTGLLLGMFVAILSSTVVSNALPTIVHELNGTESGYTWVVTSTLLATTIATPIWGKLSDLFDKKRLVQLALVIFVIASGIAGASQNMAMLITMRVFQGIGAGGLTALSQVIIASMVSPRERGRYSGYMGATFALATVAGPLIGGAITEHISWRWCFYVGVPFAIAAILVLQKTLHLPAQQRRKAHIDYLGAILLAGGVSALLIWVSLAGDKYEWWSWQTGAMVGGGIVLLALTIMAERIAPEPIIPLRLFRNPTIVLASLASLFVGIGMFAGTVFLGQYFQLARGETPTAAGLLTLPMILGMFLSSTVSGLIITRTGKWKAWLCTGGLLLTAGLGLMGTVDYDTNYWIVAAWMFLIGVGIGMMMQNLVLAVQNEVRPSDLGAASSFVAFTRSMGGAIGVSALGALLANRVKDHLVDGFTQARINPGNAVGSGIPHIASLPQPVRRIVQDSYGQGVAEIFLAAAPFALIAFLITLFVRETVLRTRDLPEEGEETPVSEDDQVWNTPADHDFEPRMTRAEWEAQSAPALAGATASRGASDGVSSRMPAARPEADTARSAAPEPSATAAEPATTAPGLSVFGVVQQGSGSPVRDARVTLADQTGRQLARTITALDGSYAMPVGNGGTYLLIVAADGVAPEASLVPVADSAVRRDITLAGTGWVSGRVTMRGETITPVADALVTLTDVTGQVVGSQRTGSDGGYVFERLTSGPYVLTAQSGHHRPLARTLEVSGSEATICDLLMAAGGHLEGVVLAASDRMPVRHATVTLTDSSGQVAGTAVTGADGAYRFADLEAGSYVLVAAGYAPVAREVSVVEGGAMQQSILLGDSTETDLSPERTAADL